MRHPHQALPPGPLAIKWKGAKITTEHGMHILRAYRVSLASLRPNQGKQQKNWAQEHATHIAKWAAHATIIDAPPFHGEISYNDEYMVWFCPHTIRHITKETSYWDTLVESQLRIMVKCKPGSEIYTDCIKALQSVEEIGQLTLDDARDAGNTSELAVGCGRQASGRQRHGGRQSSQRPTSTQPPTLVPTFSRRPTSSQRHTPVPTSSRRRTSGQHRTPVPTSSRRPTSSRCHTPVHDHTMEEASQTADEMCLDTGYDMGSMAHDDAGPSHTFAHGDTSRSPSMRTDGTCPPTSPTTSPLPTTCTSLPLTTGTALADVHGKDEMRFMPTPGRPTPGAVPPEFVHTEFIQTQIPTPPLEASHIEGRPQRLQRTQTHPLDCGTGHGKVRPVKEPVRRRKRE
nr:hypothetical protein CFP56_20007 [Quercus suber]